MSRPENTSPSAPSAVEVVRGPDGQPSDILLREGGKARRMWGRDGREREQALAASAPDGPVVLVGAGLGLALAALLAQGRAVAVLDKEAPLQAALDLPGPLAGRPGLTWIDDPDPAAALDRLRAWLAGPGRGAAVLKNPFYLRRDPGWYPPLARIAEAPTPAPGRTPPRQGPPRILLLTSQYFLLGEIKAACERAGLPHRLLDLAGASADLDAFVSRLLAEVSTLRPDFVLTVNHLGVDREGVLAEILNRLGLPLASWFVDNPHLILPLYEHLRFDRMALFTWDADTVEPLAAEGFGPVFFLPLGADPSRFGREAAGPAPEAWKADVSFVGNSMVLKTALRQKAARPGRALLRALPELAADFGASDEPRPSRFLAARHPHLLPDFEALGTPGRKLAFETLVTWRSTLEYRLACVKKLLPFAPLVAGDRGWKKLLPEGGWRHHPELAYYDELPRFYAASKINFNCTSLQMKGAVNQRVFDVPLAGGFLLTDRRRQMDDLFEPGREVVCFASPEEIPELVARHLADPKARRAVSAAARRRILADHTYDRRLADLTAAMARTFG